MQFGQHQPLYTPFRLTHGLPAGWAVARTDSVVTNGRPLVWQLEAGPAVQPQALTIADDPQGGVCDLQPPQSTLTAGGIHWDYYYSTGAEADQSICATHPRRWPGYLNMYYFWRGHAQALNLASLVRSMTLPRLGPVRLDHPADCRVGVPTSRRPGLRRESPGPPPFAEPRCQRAEAGE